MLSPQMALRTELLRIVLRDTLKKTGIPPQWIGGETTPWADAEGRLSLEVRLILECNEPRVLYYLGAFQKEFEATLLAMEPNAWDWVSRISWSLSGHGADLEADFDLPGAEYWQAVVRDRKLVVHQEGGLKWEREELARHFAETQPGGGNADFQNTQPPMREVEDLRSPPS
jgi:hypothetical protein